MVFLILEAGPERGHPLSDTKEIWVAPFALPKEREPVTALAPHPSPALPRERELVTMDRPVVCCGGGMP